MTQVFQALFTYNFKWLKSHNCYDNINSLFIHTICRRVNCYENIAVYIYYSMYCAGNIICRRKNDESLNSNFISKWNLIFIKTTYLDTRDHHLSNHVKINSIRPSKNLQACTFYCRRLQALQACLSSTPYQWWKISPHPPFFFFGSVIQF